MGLLGELHYVRSVPLFISYLAFRREAYPGETSGVLFHVPIDGNEYPAILALGEIGAEARLPLLIVVESGTTDQLTRNNAAQALLHSFYQSKMTDGIIYLRNAEKEIGPLGKRNLEASLAYLKTTPACLRHKEECASAFAEDISSSM